MDTEEEAKQKFCHLRVGMVPSSAREAEIEYANCLGSRCMAWRWTKEYTAEMEPPKDFALVPTGYCGLAGNP